MSGMLRVNQVGAARAGRRRLAPLDRFVAYIREHVLGMQPEGSANEPTRGPQMRVMRDA